MLEGSCCTFNRRVGPAAIWCKESLFKRESCSLRWMICFLARIPLYTFGDFPHFGPFVKMSRKWMPLPWTFFSWALLRDCSEKWLQTVVASTSRGANAESGFSKHRRDFVEVSLATLRAKGGLCSSCKWLLMAWEIVVGFARCAKVFGPKHKAAKWSCKLR